MACVSKSRSQCYSEPSFFSGESRPFSSLLLFFRFWADLSEIIAAPFHRESRVPRRLQREDLIQRIDGPADHSAVDPVLVNVARRRMPEIVAVHEQLDFLGPVRNSALNPNDDSLHGTSSLALDSEEVNAVTKHIGCWGVPQSWRRPNLCLEEFSE